MKDLTLLSLSLSVPFPYGNLIYGQMRQASQFRSGELPLKLSFLYVFDHVPTDAQMSRNVLNRHMPGQFQRIPLKGPRIADSFFGKLQSYLTHRIAQQAPHPLHGNVHVRSLAADRHCPQLSHIDRSADDVPPVALRAPQSQSILSDSKNNRPSLIHCRLISVSSYPKCMIQQACRHVVASFSEFLGQNLLW
jgi:hypothetical protein